MKWSTRTTVSAAFGLAMAILILVDATAYRGIRTLATTVRQLTHTHQVRVALGGVLAQLKNAETGQRGYLLTGDDRYLEPYHTASQELLAQVATLRRLTADDSVQRRRVERLQPLIGHKVAELGQTIDLRADRGFDAAVEIVRTDQGKAIMDSIRALAATMEDEETKRLAVRDAAQRSGVRFAFYIIGFGSLLGLALMGLAALEIRRDIARRERAELALKHINEGLETRIRERTTELERANEDMQSTLDRLQLGTAIVNDQGRIEFASQVAQRLLGWSTQNLIGRHWSECFPVEEADRAQLEAALASPGGYRRRIPMRLHEPHGRQYWVQVDVQDDARDPRQRIVSLSDVSELYDLRRQLGERARFHDLVGRSSPMERVYQLIREVSKVDSTVLIEGETGTGKELVAQAIHLSSERHHQPFIAVNSAGLTDALLASQLFGHRRGAFTGAIADNQGFFEAADGGTLFLDEIGDVPPSVQVALLRVLQEKEITRLGEARPHKVNVRVLAATQHQLTREVERGAFRADLMYRLRVARIVLPALRERREDIPLLVEAFLSQARAVTGKDARHVSDEAMRLLLDHSWPGNVRELKSAIEFAVIRCEEPVVRAADLPPEVLDAPVAAAAHLTDTEGARDDLERILAAIRAADGNRSEAARRLGLSRSTLYRRLADPEKLAAKP